VTQGHPIEAPAAEAALVEAALVEAATVAALRKTRESWVARRRQLRPVGMAMLVIVVCVMATKPPRVGLHGDSLGLTLALAGFVIGILGGRQVLIIRPAPWRWYVPFLAVLLASSAVLVWLQPDGPAVVGFLAALLLVWMSRVIPSRVGAVLVSVAFLAMLLTAAITSKEQDHSRWVGIAVSVLPVLTLFFVTWVFTWSRRMSEQALALLGQAEQTRDAELRTAALAERQRLARDMHDVLAHTLSGLTLQLEGARLMAQSGGDARVAGAVERAHELAKSGLAEARQAISMLRGDELPGPDRLAGLTDAFAADTGIPCRFTVSGAVAGLRPEVKLALYRVTQEALTNIRKHAHPDQVRVTLEYLTQDVELAIQDFGTAPLPALGWVGGDGLAGGDGLVSGDGLAGGYGLAGMRERAELLGGTLTAGPTEDGFRVELRVAA
jgi:signal transduction histidine kinase